MLRGLKTATVFNAAHLMPTCVSKTYNCLFFIVEIWSLQLPLSICYTCVSGSLKGEMKYINHALLEVTHSL